MNDYVEVAEKKHHQQIMLTIGEMGELARQSGIKEVLTRWGNWARCRPGTGYPKKSAGMGQNPETDSLPICSDDEGLIVDKAMLGLKKAKPDHYTVVFNRYVIGATHKQVAEYMKIRERQCYDMLAQAEFSLSVVLLSITSIFEA